MTQRQMARLFGVPDCDVTNAVAGARLRPDEIDMENVGTALMEYYNARAVNMQTRADRWYAKRDEIRRAMADAREG